jgi:Fe-S cluster biogenesis protein NfuA
VRLVAVEGDVAVLAFEGACHGCHAQPGTLAGTIEPALRAELPWLAGVRSARAPVS